MPMDHLNKLYSTSTFQVFFVWRERSLILSVAP